MGVDVFPHLHLEERIGSNWAPVALTRQADGWSGATLERGVAELSVPYEELGDGGMQALESFALARFGLVKRAPLARAAA